MLNSFTTKQKRLAIAAVIIAALGWAILWFVGNLGFKVVAITPPPGDSVPTSTTRFEIRFNKKLKSGVDYQEQVRNRTSIMRLIEVKDKSLFITVDTLDADQTYSFEVTGIQAENGKKIDKVNLKFTTKYVPYDKLSKQEQQLQLSDTDHGNKEDPLAAYLPQGALGYYLTGSYIENDEGLPVYVLKARILLTSADVRIDRDAAIAARKQEIRDFITSKNLNPDDYLIDYEIVEPTL